LTLALRRTESASSTLAPSRDAPTRLKPSPMFRNTPANDKDSLLTRGFPAGTFEGNFSKKIASLFFFLGHLGRYALERLRRCPQKMYPKGTQRFAQNVCAGGAARCARNTCKGDAPRRCLKMRQDRRAYRACWQDVAAGCEYGP
jgi:hypothetical protein